MAGNDILLTENMQLLDLPESEFDKAMAASWGRSHWPLLRSRSGPSFMLHFRNHSNQ